MQLFLSPTHGSYLQQMLARAVPQLRDSATMAPMKAYLHDLMQRLAKGEREFELDAKQARYLRRTVRAIRAHMRKQADTPAGITFKTQLAACKPIFERVLDAD